MCDFNPARSCSPCRETLESSWITAWMTKATAASTVVVVTAIAAATTSPWAASTRGLTTTKEDGSSVRLSCRATGGLHVCWGGSEECVCAQSGIETVKMLLQVQILLLIKIPDHLSSPLYTHTQSLFNMKHGPLSMNHFKQCKWHLKHVDSLLIGVFTAV